MSDEKTGSSGAHGEKRLAAGADVAAAGNGFTRTIGRNELSTLLGHACVDAQQDYYLQNHRWAQDNQ